jgi:predicted AAA+ superfamily ATPase
METTCIVVCMTLVYVFLRFRIITVTCIGYATSLDAMSNRASGSKKRKKHEDLSKLTSAQLFELATAPYTAAVEEAEAKARGIVLVPDGFRELQLGFSRQIVNSLASANLYRSFSDEELHQLQRCKHARMVEYIPKRGRIEFRFQIPSEWALNSGIKLKDDRPILAILYRSGRIVILGMVEFCAH